MRLLGPRFASLRELLLAPRGSYSFELDENYFRNEAAVAHLHASLDELAGSELTRLVQLDVLTDDGERIQLTRKGLLLSDSVCAELVGAG